MKLLFWPQWTAVGESNTRAASAAKMLFIWNKRDKELGTCVHEDVDFGKVSIKPELYREDSQAAVFFLSAVKQPKLQHLAMKSFYFFLSHAFLTTVFVLIPMCLHIFEKLPRQDNRNNFRTERRENQKQRCKREIRMFFCCFSRWICLQPARGENTLVYRKTGKEEAAKTWLFFFLLQ